LDKDDFSEDEKKEKTEALQKNSTQLNDVNDVKEKDDSEELAMDWRRLQRLMAERKPAANESEIGKPLHPWFRSNQCAPIRV
jgi:hypothetical protein